MRRRRALTERGGRRGWRSSQGKAENGRNFLGVQEEVDYA